MQQIGSAFNQNILPIENPSTISKAKSVLGHGGVIVIPTDTVYGISVAYNDPIAIDKIYAIKQRSKEKALPILIGSTHQLALITASIPKAAQRLIEAFWPGALTIILPKRQDLPLNLSEYPTIGVRMPDYTFTRDLLCVCGPLATTSANLSGGPNPTSVEEATAQLQQGVDLFLDGGQTAGDIPSTVVDCSGEEILILREGLISSNRIFEYI